MSDTIQFLGKLADEHAGRDAVHIAVAPVTAAHMLEPGEHVGFVDDERVTVGRVAPTIGIVDPYLATIVMPGQRFYLFLYPQTITSLRHVWQHPAFTDEPAPAQKMDKSASEAWLRAFCKDANCPSYETVMELVKNGSLASVSDEDYGPDGGYIDGEYMHFRGRDAHGEIPDEFWTHAEVVLGRTIKHKAQYFSCSC